LKNIQQHIKNNNKIPYNIINIQTTKGSLTLLVAV